MNEKYLTKTIEELHDLLVQKVITPVDLVEEAFANIKENEVLNAFITLNDKALDEAKALKKVEEDNLFWGLPIAIKDNIVTKDLRTTCASKMLENFIPIYDATVVEKIKQKHMIIIGKTNMDEFAMGSTSRTSYFGAPHNPRDISKIAGGSSGGSAACVAANLVPFALGTDTGGSIRQPASYTGIVGMKPTYGSISRYGLVAFASSLDQIGPMTTNVKDNALLLNMLVGHDERDLTSSTREKEDFTRKIGTSIKGMKIAIPNYFMSDIVTDEIRKAIEEIVVFLQQQGASVEQVDMRYLENAVTLYQIIAMGEASSNLARFDGVRYGFRCDEPKDVEDMYARTRQLGFGDEVKRRIMVGSYLLSGKNATEYYNKALSIRDDMKKEFDRIFKDYDLIIGPTTTTVAYGLDESLDDPNKAFMDDVLVIPVNMAGLPGMSIPIAMNKDGLPIGLHIIGNAFDEATMYQLASYIEEGYHGI